MKQRQGKTHKIIIAIVLIITIAVGSFVLYHHITYDPYWGVETDIVRMKDSGRPTTSTGTFSPIGDTEFWAGFHLYRYTDEDNKDWDYCTVNVSREKGHTYYVFFERQLDISDVPEELIKTEDDIIFIFARKNQRVLTFDENSGLVTFVFGENTFTYKLPEN